MDSTITVVKLSGKALNATPELEQLFSAMRSKPCVVVHGGGVEVDSLLSKLGFASTRLDGLRVTGKEELYYITGALAGSCGRYLQADATRAGLKPLSLLCSDYEFLKVKRLDPKYGEVGSCKPNACRGVYDLLEHGFTPIFCSLGICADGSILNINADDVAAAAAAALDARLIFLSDVPGVLDEEGQLISSLSSVKAQQLQATGVISGGMAVKVQQAFAAAAQCHHGVVIASIFDPKVIAWIKDGSACGTLVES